MQVGIIGFGNMGSAFAQGLKESSHIVVYDKEESKKEQAIQLGFGVSKDLDFLLGSDFLLLAVKPKDAEEVLNHLKGKIDREILVSIVAGLSLERMKSILGEKAKIIRTMPNINVKVQKGCIAFTTDLDEETKEKFINLFSSCGKLYPIEERLMDSFTALAGSGPAFVFKFISGLAMAGVMEGFDYKTSLDIVLQTIVGSCQLLEKEKVHPDELVSKVTSPGGTTVEGIKLLLEKGFEGILMECIRKTSEKAKKL